ncbi:MAG: Coenzyme A biosynthesis bifunctional protein CoaBC [Candidatus Hinthialibacteria bacterium OLB16]|nr:MAG: Coenzyme A biosynthesis bifunctional protein CoaBC [Candidatus Hinthialibacteria bacterium OLB16]
MNIILAISGGIAACKAPRLVSLLTEKGHTVRVVATQNGLRFVSQLTLAALSGYPVSSDMWEDSGDFGMSHIRLPEWADLLIVAPASANVIAKAANGIADDLLTTLLCAVGTGDEAACPVVYVPAMNTRMWHHVATRVNIERLTSWGGADYSSRIPAALACSDHGGRAHERTRSDPGPG